MDHRKVSAKGGRMNKKNHSEMIEVDGKMVNKHFSEIGRRGIKANIKKHGTDYFTNLSALGVAARRAKAQAKKGIIQKVVEAVTSL